MQDGQTRLHGNENEPVTLHSSRAKPYSGQKTQENVYYRTPFR